MFNYYNSLVDAYKGGKIGRLLNMFTAAYNYGYITESEHEQLIRRLKNKAINLGIK